MNRAEEFAKGIYTLKAYGGHAMKMRGACETGWHGGYEAAQKDLLEWARKELVTLSFYYEKMGHVTGSVGRNDTFGMMEECKKFIKHIESL